ncbi:hypothetical protein G6011_09447 [Alternaria panax]|uniref:aldehyde dehydrogenase (NAD(+)) n=1 Tax=Alternaria panax TaxID=48097 RepID=A0AAD4IB01_9PLEO|nr:hypothetical protein G6011_09447 [Alternaria panax]
MPQPTPGSSKISMAVKLSPASPSTCKLYNRHQLRACADDQPGAPPTPRLDNDNPTFEAAPSILGGSYHDEVAIHVLSSIPRRQSQYEQSIMAAKFDTTSYLGNDINNQLVSTSETRHSISPATSQPLFEVPVAKKEDLDAAVDAARKAFKPWSSTPFSERANLLLKYADTIEHHRDALEQFLTLEQGKPLSLSKSELDMTLTWLRAFATMEIKDEILQEDNEKIIYSTHPPIGLCAGIVPWNWPILLGLGKLGPALITGNTFIIKSSP